MSQTVSESASSARWERTRKKPAVSEWLICLWMSLLGAAATAGWAPLGQVWAAWMAFAVLAACTLQAPTPRRAFLRCFFFAMGFHALGHGWVFSALLNQTAAGLPLSLLGTAIFITYLATFLAMPAFVCHWLFQRQPAGRSASWARRAVWLPAVALAIAWTGAEALRGALFNGFDSLSAGYLFSAWPLRGWVPVLGVYGCGLLFFTSTTIAGQAWGVRQRSIFWPVAAGGAPVVLVLAAGAALDTKQWVLSAGAPLSFRLIQGGVPQREKFDPLARQRQITAYVEAITAAPASLIVTPETAFPVGLTELDPTMLAKVQEFSAATRSHIFLGMPHVDAQGGARNSVFQISPGQSELPRYDKTRLMPFGEYAPAGLGWFTSRMNTALNNLTPGRADQPSFEVKTGGEVMKIGVLTCHEDSSHADARQWVPRANLLINPGNLAWFEGTLALPQRLQIARVRALETGRPMLRATNTGVTAHIDEKGRVLARLPPNKAAVLSGSVQPTRGLTPFAWLGQLPAVGLASVLLLCATFARSVQPKPQKANGVFRFNGGLE